MDVSPRVPPVGSSQRGRVRRGFPDGKTLQDGEEERQHGVLHPRSLADVHPAGFHWELCCAKVCRLHLFKPLGAPLLLGKKAKQSPPKMCGLLQTEGPLPPRCVYPRAVGQTRLVFLVTLLSSSTLNCLLIILRFRLSFRVTLQL